MEENNPQEAEKVPMVEIVRPAKAPAKSGIWEFVRFAVTVVIVVVGIRMFVAQPFVVSGNSMVPTFQNKDYLIIDELTYRFHEPARGDVIVFRPPLDMTTYYIKRVIGVPGDTVTIRDSVVSIKNAAHPDGIVIDESYITKDLAGDNFSVTVPEGQYFMMGDNRPASFDSRKWGLLPKKNIIGRAFLRLYPLGKIDALPGKVSID